MDHEPLRSSGELATELARHLAELAEPGAPLPSNAQLAALVEAAFFASLYDEELRRVEFSVAWEANPHDCAAVLALAAPVPVTPKNLAKLAPATVGDATSIAVRADGDELVAWALVERSRASHPPLILRVLGAGVLRAEYAGAPRALYTRGEIHLLGGAHRVSSPALELTRTFAAWRAGADPATGIDPRAAVVTRIAARALAHGHGGMILLIPATVERPAGVRVHYAVGAGADVLVDRDTTAEAIELVARLTAIDNALLVDTELHVRGFGVQVIEGDAPRTSFRHANPYSADVHVDDLSTFTGTRHPAGVLFCMRQPDEAAAIIASQDGNLSLVIKDAGDGVRVIGSYQHTFGWR